MNSGECPQACLETQDRRRISALTGACMGLIIGLLFWVFSPFVLAHLICLPIILVLLCSMAISGDLSDSRAAQRHEEMLLQIVS